MIDTTNETSLDTEKDFRIIKKYPNRRLYDTAISSYITLEDVKRLVIEQVAIRVIEARTQADITHNTLLQIILEQEENGPPLFTTELLQQMIRFYGDSMHNMFGDMFEQGMKYFSQQQQAWQKNIFAQSAAPTSSTDPAQALSEFTKNNVNQWQQFQKMWLQNFQGWATSFNNQKDPADFSHVAKEPEMSEK
ncbi:polyhydroxyalkanoate synthesis repressor PhaR [Candidatus Berkiella cookevillensis]|uniref:PHB/PHA accumulation regulator DNA-binding domain protein n=1 Tax=Candidatus Berkiella cookevillensis TaxID=437022 RepID=A0A0Q9YPB6_9GAMM|nr:polyhydroxyalkanoate synthesis repressor PhaR [Candidatus Berkiella cookevillensis]MCS5709447.1 polyhydroxyalkanoate synthesis repressor PhaR [Candidatus Berkiella cookevillensis]